MSTLALELGCFRCITKWRVFLCNADMYEQAHLPCMVASWRPRNWTTAN